MLRYKQRTLTYFVRENLFVRLTSYLTGLDSTKPLTFYKIKINKQKEAGDGTFFNKKCLHIPNVNKLHSDAHISAHIF